jgi:hypothetical protein
MSQEPDLNEIIERLEKIEFKLGIYYYKPDENVGVALEELFERLDNRTFQEILREVDAKDLARAVIGFKLKAFQNLKNALSKNAWEMICDDIRNELRLGTSIDGIQSSQTKILKVAHQMESMGQIVLPETRDSFETEEYRKKQKEFWEKHNKEIALRAKKIQEIEDWKNGIYSTLNKI